MKRDIGNIIIHCAATPNGKWFTATDIDRWHKERGFKRSAEFRQRQEPRLESIGYHFVIGTNGALWNGRHIDEVGAHARGYNTRSIGICLIGLDKFTPEQWVTLKANVRAQLKRFPGAVVIGHNEINDHKTCPGFDVEQWFYNDMAPLADHLLETGDA